MAVTGFCHAAIGISDPEKSIAFYRDVLGLTVTRDVEERGKSSTFHRRAIYLRWDAETRPGVIVLDHHLDRAARGRPAQMFDLAIHHIGLAVDDVRAILARAEAAGYEVFADLTPYDAAAFGISDSDGSTAVTTAIVKDPDGHIIQLDEWA
jgi:catechol 2,3-dioxygenase-like lactoylglutathione lyase family enzyme